MYFLPSTTAHFFVAGSIRWWIGLPKAFEKRGSFMLSSRQPSRPGDQWRRKSAIFFLFQQTRQARWFSSFLPTRHRTQHELFLFFLLVLRRNSPFLRGNCSVRTVLVPFYNCNLASEFERSVFSCFHQKKKKNGELKKLPLPLEEAFPTRQKKKKKEMGIIRENFFLS